MVHLLTPKLRVASAWLVWFVLWIAVSGIVMAGTRRFVTEAYREAALKWVQGQGIYEKNGNGFLYLPSAAVLYVPFALMPEKAGDIFWRLLTIGCFALGVWRFSQLAGRRFGKELFLPITLICLPLALSCARNGQSNLLLGGLMMLAVVELAGSRWWRAAACLSLALAVKPLAVVLLLLAFALYPSVRWRLAAALAAALFFPVITQHPTYVVSQYWECIANLRTASDLGSMTYHAQLFGMLQVAGWEVNPRLQALIRIGAALGTLGQAWQIKRNMRADKFAIFLFAMASCYLMLFNPRNECCTYALLGPAVAAFAAIALNIERRPFGFAAFILVAIAVAGNYEIGKLIVPNHPPVWMAPAGCLLFAVLLLPDLCRRSISIRFSTTREIANQYLVNSRLTGTSLKRQRSS